MGLVRCVLSAGKMRYSTNEDERWDDAKRLTNINYEKTCHLGLVRGNGYNGVFERRANA